MRPFKHLFKDFAQVFSYYSQVPRISGIVNVRKTFAPPFLRQRQNLYEKDELAYKKENVTCVLRRF